MEPKSVVELWEFMHAILAFTSKNSHSGGWPEATRALLAHPLNKHGERGLKCALDKALVSTGLQDHKSAQTAIQNLFHMCDTGMIEGLSYLDLGILRQTLMGACKGDPGTCRLQPLKFQGPSITTWQAERFKFELRLCLEHLPEALGHRVSKYKGPNDTSQIEKKE